MISVNDKEFTLNLQAAWMQSKEDLRLQLIKIGLEAFELLVRHSPGAQVPGTPRDTGYAVNGWYATLNTPGDGDERGGNPMMGLSVWANAKVGDVLWINNGVAYIRRLENGHSQQAPYGMVEPALAYLTQKYGGQT